MDPEAIRQLLGIDNMSPEEREAQGEQALREVQMDHIIKSGVVYLNADEVVRLLNTFCKALAIRGMILNDKDSVHAAMGVEMVADGLSDINGELIRREADRLFGL